MLHRSQYVHDGLQRPQARRPIGSAIEAAQQPPTASMTPPAAAASIRRVTVDLTVARSPNGAEGPLVIDIGGTTVWCAKGSDDEAMIELQIGDQDPVPFARHYKVEGLPFRRLVVSNEAQAGKSVVLVIINDPAAAGVKVE